MLARRRSLIALPLVLALALWWLAGPSADAQEPPVSGEIPAAGGVAILLLGAEAMPTDLASALTAEGCQPVSVAITVGGAFVVYIPGAPAFVNAQFPASLAAETPFVVRCAPVTPPPAELGNECSNEAIGYTVRFPTDWHTNDNTVVGPCVAFGPDPFVVEPATELIMPIVIGRTEEALADAVAQLTPQFYEILFQEETTVAGRDAILVETRATGEGLLDAGIDQYSYYVTLDAESTLVLTATEIEGIDYEMTKDILDQMVTTLQLGGGQP